MKGATDLPLRPGQRYTIELGYGPSDAFYEDDVPWVRAIFTAKFRRQLRPAVGEWNVYYFDNGVLLEGNAWRAELADGG